MYDVPAAIDDGVARVKLETLGIAIDTLTEEQIKYMNSWNFETGCKRANGGSFPQTTTTRAQPIGIDGRRSEPAGHC